MPSFRSSMPTSWDHTRPPEARHSEDGYRFLSFPFEGVAPPPFQFVQEWDMNRLAAYMGT